MSIGYQDDHWMDPEELRAANARHDAQMKAMGMEGVYHSGRLAGKLMVNIVGEVLTDRKIGQYEALGYYSAEYRDARKKFAAKKKAKMEGNFDVSDGRMIYRP